MSKTECLTQNQKGDSLLQAGRVAEAEHQVARILQQFKPVIEAIVAGCEGNEEAKQQVKGLFGQWSEEDKFFVEAIERIWAGERDEKILTENTAYETRAIILAVLSLLNGQSPFEKIDNAESQPTAPEQEQPQSQSGQQQEMSLTDLIKMTSLASGPDVPPQIKEQLMQTADHMTTEPAPEVKALGQVLKAILTGDKNPDLSNLPDEMAAVVREVLGES
ncbi:hypothetical protein QUF76_07430 [Desulfobacterales bacterium HSG16]|nr:hypothetical protein [Desulfobacterales bacterium HSG16]